MNEQERARCIRTNSSHYATYQDCHSGRAKRWPYLSLQQHSLCAHSCVLKVQNILEGCTCGDMDDMRDHHEEDNDDGNARRRPRERRRRQRTATTTPTTHGDNGRNDDHETVQDVSRLSSTARSPPWPRSELEVNAKSPCNRHAGTPVD